MNLGSMIKDLRTKKKLTQEQLADLLSVSVQTISRWETSMNYPDVTMLPILANIFNVTTDHLLGVDISQNKETIEKIKKEAQELNHIGHLDEALVVLRNGVKQFPNDYELQLLLCETLNFHQSKDKDNLNNVISISENILETTTIDKYRKRAISTLFYAYYNLKDKVSARKVYDNYIADGIISDHFSHHVFEGDELVDHLQNSILEKFSNLWSKIMTMRNLDVYTDEEKIVVLDKLNQLTSIFFENEDLGFYNWYLFTVNEKIAFICAKLEDKEITFKYLNKAMDYSIKFDTRKDELIRTSILVNKTKEVKNESITNGKGNCSYVLLERLTSNWFDFIRNDSRFSSLIETLNKYSMKY